MNVSNRIRNLRKRKGITQTELANLLGKQLRTVQKYESGEIEPSITVIEQTASVLDVSIAELLGIEVPISQAPSFYELVIKELEMVRGMKTASDDEQLKVAAALIVLRDYLKGKESSSLKSKKVIIK